MDIVLLMGGSVGEYVISFPAFWRVCYLLEMHMQCQGDGRMRLGGGALWQE